MITRDQFGELYPLVNEIVAFSDSFANEDNSLFRYFKTKGKVYGSNDLIKIIRSNILSDLLHCYFTLGYQQNYNSNCYVLFDLLQYAFWFDTNHFSYEDFVKYTSSQSNASYFLKGFNNTKRDNNSVQFPALYTNLNEVDPSKGGAYILILKKIATKLSENQDKETKSKDELVNDLFTYLESFFASKDHNNEGLQIKNNNRENNIVTNEAYEELYILTRRLVSFVNLFTNKSDCNSKLSKYLKTIGCSFSNNLTLKDYVQIIIENDILKCYFLLGYQQIYQKDFFRLFEMVQYCFNIHDIPRSYNEFQNILKTHNNFFSEVFEISKNAIDSYDFPTLYIYLSEVNDNRTDEYISILQKIVVSLSKNMNGIANTKDPQVDILLTHPQDFLQSEDDNKESHIEENKNMRQIGDEGNDFNKDNNFPTMNLLKDKLINGVSFEIIKEEYVGGMIFPFRLHLRISNYNDSKKKIKVDIKYISIKHGLKTRGGVYGDFIPDNSFVDLDIGFEDITGANNGDRIELIVNDGKFATLRLIRERGQWAIVESIERTSYNRDLKSKIEHFEAIDEQFGINLQNFSVKVEDESSLKVFCEVLALNGEIPENDFTINIAIYDNNNDIVYTDSESRYAEDFKGFEVLTFDSIRLGITVDEISKIRIYPTR